MTITYDCSAKIISPVHIGSGNSYGASEYVKGVAKLKDKKVPTFKRIDVSKYYLSLEDDRKDRFLQSLSNPNFALQSFDRKIPNDYRVYTALDYCKEKPKENNDIDETIKTLNQAYIPGTSLKGAVKTAILYNCIDVDDIPDILKEVIQNNRGRVRIDRRNYNNFIDGYFSAKYGNASQKSIMRFLKISDTSSVKTPTVYDVFTVMAAERGGRNTSQLFKGGVRNFLETIRAGYRLNFRMVNDFDRQTYSELKINDKENLIEIDNIKSAIYNFSKAYIAHEMEFADKYEISYLSKFYKSLEKVNKVSQPLLKVGAGSGFLATTIGLKVLEYDDYNFDDYMGRIADATRGKTYDFCFPKSRKVTSKGGKPLGWVQLSFKEREEE